MAQVDEGLIAPLRKVRNDLRALDPRDRETLVRIGAELEQTLGRIPPEFSSVISLLSLCLEGLQAIYQQTAADLDALVQTIAGAIVAAEQGLSASSNPLCEMMVYQATQTLRGALPHAGGTAGDRGERQEKPLSLDDIAALMVPLEPDDRSEWARVRDALSGAAATHPTLAEAARLADALARGEAADPPEAITNLGRLLEQAQWEQERSTDSGDGLDRSGGDGTDNHPLHPLPQSADSSPSFDALPPDADPNLLSDYIIESRDYIEGAEAALLALETDPDDDEAINIVFRAFHTIKGTSAFLGVTGVAELAHRAESLFSRIRDREIRYGGGYADLALRSVDMLKALLQSVQDALGGEPLRKPQGYDDLMRLLADPEAPGLSAGSEAASPPRIGEILVAQGRVRHEEVEAVAAAQGEQPIGVALVKSGMVSAEDMAHALRVQQRLSSAAAHATDATVRVRTDRLDRLIDMVGELVIAHSMIAQDEMVQQGGHYDLARKVSHAGKIVRELQDLSMSMRMVPLKPTFQKMARLVRDLAHKSGKRVEFTTDGEDTEIDRNMVDVVSDPLVHMIRNAVDHGIERPEEREQKGKAKAGRVHLSAYHAGGNVVIELRDDGRGLNRDKIVQKAIECGLIESDKGLSDHEIYKLIFAP
ncbi:MAG: Hpt domain-containing protein, partial [Abditibacteriales bacterium]|nr:Hpt domain-containing protein [Abditibacteriales bacterium]MDW8367391.1 Hpt domain-containing protein [Abditibacteriales bacterium]